MTKGKVQQLLANIKRMGAISRWKRFIKNGNGMKNTVVLHAAGQDFVYSVVDMRKPISKKAYLRNIVTEEMEEYGELLQRASGTKELILD